MVSVLSGPVPPSVRIFTLYIILIFQLYLINQPLTTFRNIPDLAVYTDTRVRIYTPVKISKIINFPINQQLSS